MSADIPRGVPAQLRSGDVWQFILPGGDYPADDGWSARIRFLHKESDAIPIMAVADGSDFKFSLTPTEPTAGWWDWQASVSKASVGRVTIGSGRVEVLPDLFDSGLANFDGQSENEKILEAVEATLNKNASLVHQTVTVDGVAVVHKSLDQLVEIRRIYRGLVAEERRADRLRQGKRAPLTLTSFSA